MSFVNRGTAVIFCLALAFTALAGASPALGQSWVVTTQQCKDKWDEAPASGSAGGCGLLGGTGAYGNKCVIHAACKIDAGHQQPGHHGSQLLENTRNVKLDKVSGMKRCPYGALNLADEDC